MREEADELSERLKTAPQDSTEDRDTADADVDRVVRGVDGTASPKAQRVRPLAGIILILLVAAAAGYMQHGLKNRRIKKSAQIDAPRTATGPATTSEKSWMDDETRLGLDTGFGHVSASMSPRPSIISQAADSSRPSAASAPGAKRSSVPELEYTPTGTPGAANGTLSFAEEQRLRLYKEEQEAIQSSTSIRGSQNSYVQAQSPTQQVTTDTGLSQAIQAALMQARGKQEAVLPSAVDGVRPQRRDSNERLSDYDTQNGQASKEVFGSNANTKSANEYLAGGRTAALGRYELKSGWLIPAVLEQELNSDLPGLIRALARENVYDSVTGQSLLIPAGSTIVGIYNSHVGYGQSALQAVWKRIIFPDGSSLDLGGFESDDSQGAAGFRDQVDSHWVRLLSGALLTSVFAAGIQLSQGQNSSVLQSQSFTQQAGSAVGQQVGQLGVEVTRRNLNIQPTIRIRPGYRFFVRVEKDILFRGPYTPMPAGE